MSATDAPADAAEAQTVTATAYEALLLGGRSGSGKTSVATEVSLILAAGGVAHCHIEGDYLAEVHPAPPGDPDRGVLTAANLAAVWRNNAAAGYRRLVYTNTVSVVGHEWIATALGAPTTFTRVLLTAGDDTVAERLGRRETGSGLAVHLERSHRRSTWLEQNADDGVVRVPTDGRSLPDIAAEVAGLTGWLTAPPPGAQPA